jgi:hypothetical protein
MLTTETKERTSAIIVKLDEGYSLSIGDRIIACESAANLANKVRMIFEDIEDDWDDGDWGLTPSGERIAAGALFPVVLPTSTTPFPPFFMDQLPLPEPDPAPEPDPDPEDENLSRLVTALLAEDVDFDQFTDGLKEFCPSKSPHDVNAAMLIAQGIDPVRFAAIGSKAEAEVDNGVDFDPS